jgi:hypothetical protein
MQVRMVGGSSNNRQLLVARRRKLFNCVGQNKKVLLVMQQAEYCRGGVSAGLVAARG